MELPPEIMTNILYRLPAKSLGRFRCVSKNFLSQISQPQFIKSHQTTLNRNHLICDSNNGSLYSLPLTQPHKKPNKLTFELPHSDFTFHGSCNGLVLASADDVTAHSLVVFNPTTKEVVKLPESSHEMINNLFEIDIMYGFGYDSLFDDYKVVTVSYFHYNYLIPPDGMSVHVYSFRDNTWRRAVDSPYDHSHGKSFPGVFVNGCLHWIVRKGSSYLRVIVAFSLADETLSEVASPDFGDGCKLVVVGEKLGVFVGDEVWLMDEYGVRESWSRILIRGLCDVAVVEPDVFYDDGKVVLVGGNLMRVYRVEEECLREGVDVSRNVKGLKVRGSYVESLVSPKFR